MALAMNRLSQTKCRSVGNHEWIQSVQKEIEKKVTY